VIRAAKAVQGDCARSSSASVKAIDLSLAAFEGRITTTAGRTNLKMPEKRDQGVY